MTQPFKTPSKTSLPVFFRRSSVVIDRVRAYLAALSGTGEELKN